MAPKSTSSIEEKLLQSALNNRCHLWLSCEVELFHGLGDSAVSFLLKEGEIAAIRMRDINFAVLIHDSAILKITVIKMNSFKPPGHHHCQIDCTNHDEVINNLEIKSKDLYYFWVFVV